MRCGRRLAVRLAYRLSSTPRTGPIREPVLGGLVK